MINPKTTATPAGECELLIEWEFAAHPGARLQSMDRTRPPDAVVGTAHLADRLLHGRPSCRRRLALPHAWPGR